MGIRRARGAWRPVPRADRQQSPGREHDQRAGRVHEGDPVGWCAVEPLDHACECGARAIDGYPDLVEGGYLGTYGVFAAAEIAEVGRPTNRRAVMRIDF